MKVKKQDIITIANRLNNLREKGEEKSDVFIETANTLVVLIREYFKIDN